MTIVDLRLIVVVCFVATSLIKFVALGKLHVLLLSDIVQRLFFYGTVKMYT